MKRLLIDSNTDDLNLTLYKGGGVGGGVSPCTVSYTVFIHRKRPSHAAAGSMSGTCSFSAVVMLHNAYIT